MGNQPEIRESVKERTKKYGIGELDQQRNNIQEQLIKIEENFQNVISEQNHVKKRVKQLTKHNILSVSEATNIPRATINNNPNTLKFYIEKRIEEIQKEDILGIDKAKQSIEKNEFFSGLVEDFKLQFVERYELELQIEYFEKELKTKLQQIEKLTRDKTELEQENQQLKRQLNKAKVKVVPIRS
ncbi:hypothetical protein [Oceanobacillus damuensis]|uniref:hypothetical protein n=1 Tax=Oceanobacillus damuensis TaxID=937928 RepID=UPI00082E524C|nr:hypothetical protein [Oceanobacillus damuensis]